MREQAAAEPRGRRARTQPWRFSQGRRPIRGVSRPKVFSEERLLLADSTPTPPSAFPTPNPRPESRPSTVKTDPLVTVTNDRNRASTLTGDAW